MSFGVTGEGEVNIRKKRRAKNSSGGERESQNEEILVEREKAERH